MFREIVSNEIFILLLVLGLVLIAAAKVLFTKKFDDFIHVLINFRYLKVYSREYKFVNVFDALLFLNLLISSTIFVYLFYRNVIGEVGDVYVFLFKTFAVIGVIVISKILIERLVGSLFNIGNYVDVYLFQKMSYKNFFGLLLIPINAILLFSITPTPAILQILVIVFVLINCIGLIASYQTYQSLMKSNLVYFILYLCALEISPYLLLYKLFIDFS